MPWFLTGLGTLELVSKMTNAALKFLAFGLMYYLAGRVGWGLHYAGLAYPLTLAAVMAAVGGVADRVIVPRLGNALSTGLGASFIAVVTYVSQWLFPGVTVTPAGALLVGAIGGVYEYATHAILLSR